MSPATYVIRPRPQTLYLQTMQQFKGGAEEIVLSQDQGNYCIVWGFDLVWIHLCNWTEQRKTMMEVSLVEIRMGKDHSLFTNIRKTDWTSGKLQNVLSIKIRAQ